jgi:hypothetical protein
MQLRLNIEGNFKESNTRIGTEFIWLRIGIGAGIL